MLRFAYSLVVFLAASVTTACAGPDMVSIRTAGGEIAFSVELAETPQARATGLMYRRALAPDAGMLFDFGRTAPVSMWMKNTLIPLDMLFVKSDGTITNIIHRATPGSLDARSSSEPVLAVLEVNGGTAARLHIRPGDRLYHPLFGNSE